MHKQHIEKVKAEITRLQDMEKRLKDVFGENEDEAMALESADVDLGNAIVSLKEALDYAEGRKESTHPFEEETVEAPDASFPNDDAEG